MYRKWQRDFVASDTRGPYKSQRSTNVVRPGLQGEESSFTEEYLEQSRLWALPPRETQR